MHKHYHTLIDILVFVNKVLAKKPMPWRINILLELAAKGMEKISQVVKDSVAVRNSCSFSKLFLN